MGVDDETRDSRTEGSYLNVDWTGLEQKRNEEQKGKEKKKRGCAK